MRFSQILSEIICCRKFNKEVRCRIKFCGNQLDCWILIEILKLLNVVILIHHQSWTKTIELI